MIFGRERRPGAENQNASVDDTIAPMPSRRIGVLVLFAMLLVGPTACGRVGFDSHPRSEDASVNEADAAVLDADAAEPDLSVPPDTSVDQGVDAAADLGMPLDPGVLVSPSSGLSTSEAGGSATFSVALRTAPSANVYIVFLSASPTEVSVSGGTIAFTPTNWNVAQIVTLHGVDDSIADGDMPFRVWSESAVSSDTVYSGVAVPDVNGTNVDDDVPSIVVSPTSGLSTSEAGGTAAFDVHLAVAPTSDVSIPVVSLNRAEGVVSSASPLTFTATNWNISQTVTVTGVDDSAFDGPVDYVVRVGPSMSSAILYDGVAGADVVLTNIDDDMPGLVVLPQSDMHTREDGSSAELTVELTSQPSSDVDLTISSSNTLEGTPAPTFFTFTALDWSVPRTVTVTGVDDFVSDGDQPYQITVHVAGSSDADYASLPEVLVDAVNEDDEAPPAIFVSPTSGLITSEQGANATFTMSLSTPPSSAVSVSITSNTPTEGTVSAPSVTFTTTNWSTPQTITVTGVSDHAYDGDVAYTVVTGAAASLDLRYNGLAVADVGAINLDIPPARVAPPGLTSRLFGSGGFDMSLDGSTIAAATAYDDSGATGINGNQSDHSTMYAGATYVLRRISGVVTQEAYVKASNTEFRDFFGSSIALSADGNTLVVGAPGEDSSATGMNGNQADNSASDAGAVYVFVRSGTTWMQQAYLKASNTGASDRFGNSVALSADGNTLLVGADHEASAATNVNGNELDNTRGGAGAAYVYTRAGAIWTKVAYLKASNTDANDLFGSAVALSADGHTAAIGAIFEGSSATGINGDGSNNTAGTAGAAYVYHLSGAVWSFQAYVKASNTESSDFFGQSISLSDDGDVLAVGAYEESSNATGVGGLQSDNSATGAGAAYVFRRSGAVWAQEAYLKASNTEANDNFGYGLRLNHSGTYLCVGARNEASNALGINGNQLDNSSSGTGAAYLFHRGATTWQQTAYIKPTSLGAGAQFATTAAFSSDDQLLAIDAPYDNSQNGGLYFYEGG